ncbi:hypothetical protein [Chitinophaga sp. Cy-1792]|uniref:hypothetical protein n=1 Tax=Chitinophaga sp. Cy-1792 TaxID=2608339 RepID=UPI00142425F6|nr:hypothetical protein [Chitinophaga sp. Cy-1792]NIG55253.1 hypothetical protein [Chitinophaga sp. Cy-1792]
MFWFIPIGLGLVPNGITYLWIIFLVQRALLLIPVLTLAGFYFGLELREIEITDNVVIAKWKSRSGRYRAVSCGINDLYYAYGTTSIRPSRCTLDLIRKEKYRLLFKPYFVKIFYSKYWDITGLEELERAYVAAGIEEAPRWKWLVRLEKRMFGE